jgi:hypothetical protein
MTDIATFVLSSLILGLVSSIPGLILSEILRQRRVVQNRSLGLVIASVLCVFGWRLAFPTVPLACLTIVTMVLAPVAMYRHDIWTYWTSGKFPPE